MSKRKIRTRGHKLILKEGKTHQEAFEELRAKSKLPEKEIATELSKVPTRKNKSKVKTLNTIYIVCLVLVILLRLLGLVAVGLTEDLPPAALALILIIGVFLPILGIYGAVVGKTEIYKTVGFLFIFGIVRSISKEGIETITAEPITAIAFIPNVIAIILAFYIPSKIRTNWSTQLIENENGEKVKKVVFATEVGELSDSELLDD